MILCAFEESLRLPQELVGTESKRLAQLLPAMPVAKGFVLTSALEEQFYVSNNLPAQLRQIFSHINPRRLDEEALEVACKRAQGLVLGSYLLEDAIAQVYLAHTNLGLLDALQVRREAETQAQSAHDKRDVLIATKRLWAEDWAFDAVLQRLDDAASVALEARPVLVLQSQGTPKPSAAWSAQASRVLGKNVTVFGDGVAVLGVS